MGGQLYLNPFPREGAGAIIRLIDAVRFHHRELIHEWLTLCASTSAPHHAITEVFRRIYVPRLRSAVECLARGDIAGFLTIGESLGGQLSQRGVPFAAFVA